MCDRHMNPCDHEKMVDVEELIKHSLIGNIMITITCALISFYAGFVHFQGGPAIGWVDKTIFLFLLFGLGIVMAIKDQRFIDDVHHRLHMMIGKSAGPSNESPKRRP